ncbi:A disintegrin and metalloproteinase with thrombospondin motifs 9-like [Sitodiplosis mosellana]|uniref:A disintegrin and metalloproteinase with thrombospondin motifs 9-like n=1 Tax=Sitodiplosis mosellana TaxID=263140 RepID=UPI0024440264|nr:A disintegrin and metalloproteinase with thrombospondin motifs 9-like [Sitodiplosis mosellana]
MLCLFLLSLLSTSTQTQSLFLKQSGQYLGKHLTELNKNQKTETINQINLNCGNEQAENVKKRDKSTNVDALNPYDDSIKTTQKLFRSKRNVNTFYTEAGKDHAYTIETLVVVDKTTRKFHGVNNIKNYVLMLMSIASNIFADVSIGNLINVAVVDIILLEDDLNVKSLYSGKYANYTLWNFIDRMKSKQKNKHDVGLLLTRENLCLNEECLTLGLTQTGSMCSSNSYAVVQDIGLSSGYHIAHEIGHLLGALHDNRPECLPYQNNDQTHLMASALHIGTDMWSWSPCSRHFITEFLEQDKAFCLLNKPTVDMLELHRVNEVIPSPNEQCQLSLGLNVKAVMVHDYGKISCDYMLCQLGNGSYHTYNMPWADRTACDVGKWCKQRKCVKEANLKHVDGGWSQWKSDGQCSRSCGGGIQLLSRKCDNPLPEKGAKYCAGMHKMYESCNTQACLIETFDFREKQCNNMNNSTHSWTATHDVYSGDECKLICTNERTKESSILKPKVIDGTPCNKKSNDKCVNGVCRPAGCDNKLYSKAKLNKCGVCNLNDDVCEDILGIFSKEELDKARNYSKHPDYYHVGRIPKGATNIEILQLGLPADGNYIALAGDRGEYILNGDRIISPYPKDLSYGGVTFEYTGTNMTREKVSTPFAMPLQRELIIEILSTENHFENENLINYRYSIKTDHYWKLEWSQCAIECRIQSLQFICMRKYRNKTIQEQLVNASYCHNIKMSSVGSKTRLCAGSKECIIPRDSESTDNDFSPGILALIILISFIIIISIMTVIIHFYFQHFIHLCLKQLYH